MPDWRRVDPPPTTAVLGVIALGIGAAIAALDSRPGWDDAGITAGLLVFGAAIVAAVAGRRPWLWTLLVGAPLPCVEIPSSGSAAPLAAVLFAAVGSSLGILVRGAVRAARHPA